MKKLIPLTLLLLAGCVSTDGLKDHKSLLAQADEAQAQMLEGEALIAEGERMYAEGKEAKEKALEELKELL